MSRLGGPPVGTLQGRWPRHGTYSGSPRALQTPFGFYFGAGIKVLLGVSLWFAAPASRAPDVLQPLGLFLVVTGLIRLIIGPKVLRKLLDWWVSRAGLVRAWGVIAVAFGGLIIYWVTP